MLGLFISSLDCFKYFSSLDVFASWLKFACFKGDTSMLVAVFHRKVGYELRQTWGFRDVIRND